MQTLDAPQWSRQNLDGRSARRRRAQHPHRDGQALRRRADQEADGAEAGHHRRAAADDGLARLRAAIRSLSACRARPSSITRRAAPRSTISSRSQGIHLWSPGVGAIEYMVKAPHPNASKLFVNWLLSKDTQTMLMQAVKLNSQRVDVPQGDPDEAVDAKMHEPNTPAPRRRSSSLTSSASSRCCATICNSASRSMAKIPVLIAGGGPVGLALAVELGLAGIQCTLVERRDGTLSVPKMSGLSVRSMELNRRWGISEKVKRAGWPQTRPNDFDYCTSMTGPVADPRPHPALCRQASALHARARLRLCADLLRPDPLERVRSLPSVTLAPYDQPRLASSRMRAACARPSPTATPARARSSRPSISSAATAPTARSRPSSSSITTASVSSPKAPISISARAS